MLELYTYAERCTFVPDPCVQTIEIPGPSRSTCELVKTIEKCNINGVNTGVSRH
jgi:hypothetical protein